MTKIETYWCEDRPTLEDIKQAFDIVKNNGVVVSIRWYIRYNGEHERIITKEDITTYSIEDYFERAIPRTYGV